MEEGASGGQIGCAEEDPSEVDEREGEEPAEGRSAGAADFLPDAVEGGGGAMQCSPDHEGPSGSVPDTADEERKEQVGASAREGASVAAQGDIDITFEPSRQGHVPTAPKILDIERLIRRVEIFRQPDTEQQAASNRHIGIPAKIEVQLHRVP